MWWFLPDKALDLEPPRLTIESTARRGDELTIVVQAENLVRDLTVMPDRLWPGAQVDQQLITLLANEAATITVCGLGDGHGADADDAERLIAAPACHSAQSACDAGRDVPRRVSERSTGDRL
jgi:beta-mannosidase